jgi:hypothetical protein
MRRGQQSYIPSVSFFLLLCALYNAPRATTQVSCVVTYNCRSSQCTAAVGGPRTLTYPDQKACDTAAKTVGDGTIASCSCGSPAGPAAGAVTPVAPGHEFDNTINQAIAAGIAGKVSPGNAVGFIGLGLLGNALFAPKTTNPVQSDAQQQVNLAAQQLNNSGLYLFRQKNYAGAINEFQKALAQTPNDAGIINNLALAKQQLVIHQLNLKMATQTSDALGHLLGDAPPTTGLFGDQLPHSPVIDQNASPLSLVNLGSDPGVVDLGSATGISVDPDSLKGQLDGVLANHTLPTIPPDPRVEMPQAQDIELLFQPPQSTASQFPGPQRPTNSPKLVTPMMDAEERAQVEAIFAQPGGLDDTLEKQALDPQAKPASDPLLKDAVSDSASDEKTGPRVGVFGTKNSPSNPDLGGASRDAAIPTHSAAEQSSSAAKSSKDAAAAVSIDRAKASSNCQWDTSGCTTPDAENIPGHANQQNSKPVPAAVANSEGYKDLQKQREKLEKKYQELDTRLTEIRQQQASGQGDQGALAVEEFKIKNEETAVYSAKADVGRKMDDLSVSFEEETHPSKKPVRSTFKPPPPPAPQQ